MRNISHVRKSRFLESVNMISFPTVLFVTCNLQLVLFIFKVPQVWATDEKFLGLPILANGSASLSSGTATNSQQSDEDWRGQLSVEFREHLVKSMEALETGTAAKNSANPSAKAKSEMENSPKTTERYIYNTSNSKDEYYKRIADEYSAVLQRETEEKNKEPGGGHQQQESNETGWHNQINDVFREHLRNKLMNAILPQSGGFHSKVRSMKNLQLYVSEIENDIYKAAHSKTEYFHLLAEKQLKVLQEVDLGTPIQLNIDQRKKRQTQNEQSNQEYQQQQEEYQRRQQQQRQQQQLEEERLQQQQKKQQLQQQQKTQDEQSNQEFQQQQQEYQRRQQQQRQQQQQEEERQQQQQQQQQLQQQIILG